MSDNKQSSYVPTVYSFIVNNGPNGCDGELAGMEILQQVLLTKPSLFPGKESRMRALRWITARVLEQYGVEEEKP